MASSEPRVPTIHALLTGQMCTYVLAAKLSVADIQRGSRRYEPKVAHIRGRPLVYQGGGGSPFFSVRKICFSENRSQNIFLPISRHQIGSFAKRELFDGKEWVHKFFSTDPGIKLFFSSKNRDQNIFFKKKEAPQIIQWSAPYPNK